jgi:putative ABC transport system permease protein
MWRNYLTVGIRALIKSRTYAFINIFGLATGLAACLMLLVYVDYERGHDEWLPNSENLYQLQTYYSATEGSEALETQMSAYVAGTSLQSSFPQIARRVYMRASAPTVVRDGQALNVENARMVDGPFFDMFRIPMLHGDPRTALRDSGNVALSRSEAQRIFGAENPVGRTLTLIDDAGEAADHRVTGVFEDLPKNSHMRISMLVRFDRSSLPVSEEFFTSFGWQNGWVYLELRPGATAEAIHAGMPAWERRAIPDEGAEGARSNFGDQQDYRLVNVADVHLGRAQEGSMAPGNDARTIATFSIVALIILAMACFNFTNLATARAGQRAREVALRKVLGANRKQLISQFLGESTILAIVSMLTALALVELLLPSLARFLDADLAIRYFGAGGILLPVVALVVLVGAVGGLYPALYLSRFRPAEVLKANQSAAEPGSSGRLRNALVVAQFAASIALIICTSVVYAQTLFAREADPGFERSGLLQVSNLDADQIADQREALVDEVRRIPGVTAAVRTGIGINTPNTITTTLIVPGRTEQVEISSYAVGADFFRTMGVDTVAGRTFDAARPADDVTVDPERREESLRAIVARGVNVVINELAARRLGFADPRQAVGRQQFDALPVRRIWPDPGDDRRRGRGFTLPHGAQRDRADRVQDEPRLGRLDGRALRECEPHGRARPHRAGLAPVRGRRAVPGRVQRGDRGRALRCRRGAGQDLRRLRGARRGDRGARPVRARRLHRRAEDARDRHQEGVRRAVPRHRQPARLAVLEAGDRRQSDRLAGRLVGNARLAQHVRRAHRPRADAVPARRARRARDRDRHHRRPCAEGGARQSDPRPSLRIGPNRALPRWQGPPRSC